MQVKITSEVGHLQSVIIHTPGVEVENMTPQSAERALYSDILNLSVASKEYGQFKGILKKYCDVYEVKQLLEETLSISDAKEKLLMKIINNERVGFLEDYLFKLSGKLLSNQLIEGVTLPKNNLTHFLSAERYALQPLHNFFFTRDTAVCFGRHIFISKLSSQIREREALIMDAIFLNHPLFKTATINPISNQQAGKMITIEGGDILIARQDILLIGIGARTTSQGVDFIIEELKKKKGEFHIVVQELPPSPESFIHLDMVFTFVDTHHCLLYAPVILNQHDFQTVHIVVDNGAVVSINEEKNIPAVLQKLGMNLDILCCGGSTDSWIQEREQWHSGANFFAIAPGKVIGYGRNVHTLEELNNHGFSILKARDVLSAKVDPEQYARCAITIDGAELARGGGGCRCMTLPVDRKEISH